MSKELIIVNGLPNTGRTTWVNKTYTGDNTVIIEESSYPKLLKEGRYQESEFFNSIDWVEARVKEQMEKSNPAGQIVVIPLQTRPDHWLGMLELAKTHEYKFTPIRPQHGSLYYKSNLFGNMFEQIESIKKSTINRFPKIVKDKKNKKDETEVKENQHLFTNLNNEFLCTWSFVNFNNIKAGDSNPEKWIKMINNEFQSSIYYAAKTKVALEARIAKEQARAIEKLKQEAEEKAKLELAQMTKAMEEAEKAKLVVLQDVEEIKDVV